jgi:magnesium chelatase family protein
MLAKVTSCALIGLEGAPVDVEVDISRGLYSMTIVGLPDAAVQESRERVRAAIKHSGLSFPGSRITVNLAPADVRKVGPAYDLPIAVGILVASEQVWPDFVEDAMFIGELSLDGTLRHTTGMLPMASLARELQIGTVYVPAVDAAEAALIPDLKVIPVDHLSDLTSHLQGIREIAPYEPDYSPDGQMPPYAADFSQIMGQT